MHLTAVVFTLLFVCLSRGILTPTLRVCVWSQDSGLTLSHWSWKYLVRAPNQYFDWVYSWNMVLYDNIISRPWHDPMSWGARNVQDHLHSSKQNRGCRKDFNYKGYVHWKKWKRFLLRSHWLLRLVLKFLVTLRFDPHEYLQFHLKTATLWKA